MSIELVLRAIEQSESRELSVRAMALLYGARVLGAAGEVADAAAAFAEGLETAERLPLEGRLLENVLGEAVWLGATADPLAAVTLFKRVHWDSHFVRHTGTGTTLVQSLAQRGDFETALGLLEDLGCHTGGAEAVLHFASDPAVQRRALVAARERWRAHRARSEGPQLLSQNDFHRLFSKHWEKLERHEAEAWLEELLLAIREDPDEGMSARFGQRVHFHSMHDMHLFELLGVIRALKPLHEVDALVNAHPNVAQASKVYPLGLQSLMMESSAERNASGTGFSMCGSARDAPLMTTMIGAARRDPTAVGHLLGEAHHLYLEDMDPDDPNTAPRVFWPSCGAYKIAMYWAGKNNAPDAESLLQQIPDSDFALLASIELAAGALGLTQYSGVRMEQHAPNSRRTRV